MIPPSTTITDEGRRLRRILLWVGAGIVGLNILVWFVSSFAAEGATAGPTGSSYVTTPRGSAALAGTLERLEVPVSRLRVPLDEVPLPPSDTLVVIDGEDTAYGPSEVEAITRFLTGGGHLLVAGRSQLVGLLLEDPPQWRAAGASEADLSLPEATSMPVALGGFGSLEARPADEAILVAGDGLVVGVRRAVGDGTLIWVADSHPFHNIALSDSAPAAVILTDPAGTVLFDEFRHGYQESGGVWSVIPPSWRTMLLLGAAALVFGLVAYGRRFGPPYDTQRRLPPGRQAYRDAVAGILQRAGSRRTAAQLLRDEVERRLARRGSVDETTALEAGLDPASVSAIFGEDDERNDLIALDRALATLTRQKG